MPSKQKSYFGSIKRQKHQVFNAFVLSAGVLSIAGGSRLLYSASPGLEFLGAFLIVIGFQITLWVMGFRAEILGNVTSVPNDYLFEAMDPLEWNRDAELPPFSPSSVPAFIKEKLCRF